MTQARRATISALGRYVPERILTNHELAQRIDTSDEWIRSRTGIHQRHVVEPGTPTSEIAARAARECLARRGLQSDDIDLIIVATITPDTPLPSTACLVQHKLGARHAWAFDVVAACSGFLYALTVAAQFVQAGVHRRVMVIGADVMSSIIDYQDRSTCVLFGDGAGAALVELAQDDTGILDYCHETDGAGAAFLHIPAGGSARPATHETVERRQHFVHQDGHNVFKYASRKMAEACLRVLERNRLDPQAIALLVPHQANQRIIEAARQRLGMPDERVLMNLGRYGNTTGATLPLGLCTALDEQRVRPSDLVLLATVGAGFTAGALLMRWSGVPWSATERDAPRPAELSLP